MNTPAGTIWTIITRKGKRTRLFSYVTPETAKTHWDNILYEFKDLEGKAFSTECGIGYTFGKGRAQASVSLTKHKILG